MAFRVLVHPRARADLAAAVRWLVRTSPAAAARWRTGLLQIVANLETDPQRYPVPDEAADLDWTCADYCTVAAATSTASFSQSTDRP